MRDAVQAGGVPIQSFNAAHLRMIAASREKTDRRDAYWIARSLQTGMTPHPVYIPSGEVRELRRLLNRRRVVQRDRNRWQYRARAMLRAHGLRTRTGGHYLRGTSPSCSSIPTASRLTCSSRSGSANASSRCSAKNSQS